MIAFNKLPVRLLSNSLKCCDTKLNKVNTLCHWPVLSQVCRSEPAKSTHDVMTHCSLWLRTQHKVVWSQAAFHRSFVSDSQPATEESAETAPNFVSKPMRRDRQEKQQLFRQMICNKGNTPWTDDDWLQLADSLSLTGQESWEVICMHTLYVDKNISLGQNLMSYIERQGKTPSLVVVTFYIGLLGESCAGFDEEIHKYYQYLLSRSSVLDAASIEVLITGLSGSKYYRQCLQLLETVRETSNPSSASLIRILRAGLRNQDIDVCQAALSQIEQWIDPTGVTIYLPKVIEEGLSGNSQACLEMVMNFMQKHKLVLKRAELEEVVQAFHRYQPNQWTANYGFINHHKGHCSICGHQMKRSEVDSSDFHSIQSIFLDQVIVGNNVFFKSSPEEVDFFVKFVEKTGPFDVVIDGLNVMYRGCHGKSDPRQLAKVVEYFTLQGKKVLVLGTRMLTGYTNLIRKLKDKPVVYMTSTTKCDDAFFLYAALRSGKHTLVVSSDKLRDHKFLLKPSLRPVFYQWILSAQVYDWFISKSGEFIIGKRHLYETGPAKDDGGWHLPENDVTAANPFGRLSILCLRNKIDPLGSHDTDTNTKSSRQTALAEPLRQTALAGPGSSPPRHTHNRLSVTWPGKERTGKTGSGTQASTRNKKEWFDN
ncbi:unnamed protein product [Candidula unifasciata]|uniref:ribonuclease P n=1 Tax=Candidula unifasciata TaxID=100452 RepID=A0A8S3ZK13_9EUPU|nr:unnamed protein product [Candidula unifasciata]